MPKRLPRRSEPTKKIRIKTEIYDLLAKEAKKKGLTIGQLIEEYYGHFKEA